MAHAFVLRKSSLNEEQFNKFLSHRLGPGAFGAFSGSNSNDGSYTNGGAAGGGAHGASFTHWYTTLTPHPSESSISSGFLKLRRPSAVPASVYKACLCGHDCFGSVHNTLCDSSLGFFTAKYGAPTQAGHLRDDLDVMVCAQGAIDSAEFSLTHVGSPHVALLSACAPYEVLGRGGMAANPTRALGGAGMRVQGSRCQHAHARRVALGLTLNLNPPPPPSARKSKPKRHCRPPAPH